MIGLIVDAASNGGDLPNKILYKFGGKSGLERLMSTCIRCYYPQKFILSMPANDRGLISGGMFYEQSLNLNKISADERAYGRAFRASFHGRPEEEIPRLFVAASEAGMDKIVLIRASNILIPLWMIDRAVEAALQNDHYVIIGEPQYSRGFEIEVFPFWMLAHALTHNPGGPLSLHLRRNFGERFLPNEPPHELYKTTTTLSFQDRSQIPLMTRLFEELDAGADLDELLREIDEPK